MKKILLLSAMLLSAAAIFATNPSSLKVYINPGHGGYDSDDRVITVYPFTSGDTMTFAESKSNLFKGLALRQILWDSWPGITVKMSRVQNRTEDDLPLESIGRAATNWGADIFFSIHSNATGTTSRVNFPLMLYRGWDEGKGAAHGEPDEAVPGSMQIGKILAPILMTNQSTVWTNSYQVRGDWSFYTAWSYKSGLGVLRRLGIPGMLSEGSFHDYIPELYRLLNREFCWQEGWHFSKAVEQYFEVPDGQKPQIGHVSGLLIDERVPRDLRDGFKAFQNDLLDPIKGCTVELLTADKSSVVQTYVTDELFNGFYFFKNVAPGNYVVKATIPTHFDAEQAIQVKANEITYCTMKMKKQRLTPPEVVSYSPIWKEGDDPLLCNTPLVFNFNWDMDQESTQNAFSIEPAVEGEFSWEDFNYRMVFRPKDRYDVSTNYHVTISTDAEHAGGMKMTEPFAMDFFTTDRNFMEIIGQSIKDGGTIHFHDAAIEFRFDKLPNVTPILKQVSVVDSHGNAVQLNNRGLKYSKTGDPYGYFRIPFVKDLTVGEQYTLTLSPEIADKDGITLQSGLSLNFTAIDAGADKPESQLETMDDPVTLYAYDEENSANVASNKVARNTAKKLFGDACGVFTYTFTGDEGGEILWARSEATEKGVTHENRLGVHVNGDLSNNELYIQLASDNDTKFAKVCDLDFLGWKYLDVPLTMLEGENAYKVKGVKVIQVASQMGKSGEIMLDNINLIGEDGVEAVAADVADFSIYPNPASEYLIANAVVWVEDIELLNMNGAVVAKAQGNVLNVSEIPSGAYLARVNVAGKKVTQKVIIKH